MSKYPLGTAFGRVYFEWGGVNVEAVLTLEGKWVVDPGSSADKDLRDACASVADDWNRLYSLASYSPADGVPERRALLDVERVTGGRAYAESEAITPDDSWTKY